MLVAGTGEWSPGFDVDPEPAGLGSGAARGDPKDAEDAVVGLFADRLFGDSAGDGDLVHRPDRPAVRAAPSDVAEVGAVADRVDTWGIPAVRCVGFMPAAWGPGGVRDATSRR